MDKKRVAALLLSGVMAVSVLAGCGGLDKESVVATFDETNVELGVANFAARLQQASYDDFYVPYYGEEVWSVDMYGIGVTMEDSVKEAVMSTLYAAYTLEAHAGEYGVSLSDDDKAAITEAATAFINANSQEALDAFGADQAVVERYLELVTIEARMYDAIIAGADTNISDEEANTSAYSYVEVSKITYTDEEGNSVEYTDAELPQLTNTMTAFMTEAKAGTLEDAAEKYSYTVSTGTFTADTTTVDETVLGVLQSAEEGVVSDVIDTDSSYYVVRLDAKTDEAATEATRAALISERESEHYTEVLAQLQELHEWDVKENVWEKVEFNNLFTSIEETTEETLTTEE